MSRDPSDPADAPKGSPGASSAIDRLSERDPELLTAYVDAVTELSAEDRRQIERQLAEDPATRAEEASIRALLGRLRALPPEGDEPDWLAMERSIREAVGSQVPRPWWRAWRWLVPVMSCATAASMMLLLWARPGPIRNPDSPVIPPPPAISQPVVEPGEDVAATVPLWLDGAQVDVELSAAELLPAPLIGEYDPAQLDAEADSVALLPAADLAWVDHLDEDALSRAEHWLSTAAPRTGGSGEVGRLGATRKKS